MSNIRTFEAHEHTGREPQAGDGAKEVADYERAAC